LRTGIDAVGQGQLRRLIDDESQAELAQIVPALLIVAALGQLSSGIGGGKVRVETGGVIGQRSCSRSMTASASTGRACIWSQKCWLERAGAEKPIRSGR